MSIIPSFVLQIIIAYLTPLLDCSASVRWCSCWLLCWLHLLAPGGGIEYNSLTIEHARQTAGIDEFTYQHIPAFA